MMNRTLQYTILIADLLWIASAFLLAEFACNGAGAFSPGSATRPVHIPAVAVAFLVWIVLYFTKRLEGFCRGWHLPSIFAQVTVGACFLLGAVMVLTACLKYDYSLAELLCLGGTLPLGFIAIRCSAWCLVRWRRNRRSKRRVVIIGGGRMAREIAHKIDSHPEMSMEVAGILSPSGTDPAIPPA